MSSLDVLAAQPWLAVEGGRSSLCCAVAMLLLVSRGQRQPGPGSCRQGADFPPFQRDRAAPMEELITITSPYR